jgi:pimeloyl-ACP methyl ester carboxylesterase
MTDLATIARPAASNRNARAPRRGLRALRAGMRALGVVAPPLAARAAVALFRTPPRHVAWDGELAILAEGRRVSFPVGDIAVAAWTWGAGEPVLLVHGWGSTGGRLGSFVAPLVSAGHSVIAFDAPGHGATEGRRSSLPEFIFGIEAAHAAYGPFAAIVGHSLGGAATVLAMARSVCARRVVLLAPSGDPAGYTKMFAKLVGIAPAVRERMEERIVREFGIEWSEFDVFAAAHRLTQPLLVFHDEADAEIPWIDGSRIAQTWPGAQLVTTRGLGHTRIVHDPEVVARAVDFMTRQEAAGSARS